MIELAIVRVRREDRAPARVHAILAGGPGDSGVGEVLELATRGGGQWFDLMDGDVIGIDQRGTGASRPSLASTRLYDLPLGGAGSPATWLPIITKAVRGEAERLTAQGIDLTAYNTQESADDVDAVRRAFGYGPLILWGRSYGTHLALAMLRQHPVGVARLILVSPEGPDHTWKSPALADAVLHRIADRLGSPTLIDDMRATIADLNQHPASVQVTAADGSHPTISVGGFDVQLVLAQALGDPRAIAGLPSAFRQMRSGDYRSFGQLAYALRIRFGVQSAMKHAMDLSSGASDRRRVRIAREANSALLGRALNFPGTELGKAWNVAPLPPGFRSAVRSRVPALLAVGDLDIRTPVENAREIAKSLPNARIVVVENGAHQFSLFGNLGLRQAVEAFLNDAPVPARLKLPAPVAQR